MNAVSRLLVESLAVAVCGAIAPASADGDSSKTKHGMDEAEVEQHIAGGISYDLVAACFNTGQVRGILAGTDIMGPLASIGVAPQALGWDENVLLVADGRDRKLRQAAPRDFSLLPRMNDLGDSPNHIWVDGEYIYVVNSLSNMMQVFARVTQGSDTGLELTTIAELRFPANASPQAIAKAGNDAYVSLFGNLEGNHGAVAHVDLSNPSSPTLLGVISLDSLDLRPFDGGTSYPRPGGITIYRGNVYVALANLDSQFQVAGPAIVARIELGLHKPSPIYVNEACLNAGWVVATENALYVGCAGRVQYDSTYHLVSSESTGLVLVDGAEGGVSYWNAPVSVGI